MENERKYGLFAVNKKKAVGALALSGALMIAVSKDSDSLAHQPYAFKPVPQSDFVPLDIKEDLEKVNQEQNRDNSPGDKIIIVFPSPSEAPPTLPTPTITPSPKPTPEVTQKPHVAPSRISNVQNSKTGGFILDRNVSWYGPGFYGNRTACGEKLTKTLLGVANKTLPCGTMVDFKYKGSDGITREIAVPVVDRGPYVAGRQWDLTGGLAVYLHHTFTGSIYYKIEK